MPEAVNAGTRELLLRSNSVFLVTTQEPVCLHLALRRLGELIDADVPKTAIRLILNRCQRGEMEYTDVETLLGTPVFHPIPNDYRAVRRAFLASGLIAGNTALGRSFEDLASKLCGGDAHKKTGLASTLGGLFGARGASKPSETGPRTA
jgi:Flp pilus assembly CpaE family ATPase